MLHILVRWRAMLASAELTGNVRLIDKRSRGREQLALSRRSAMMKTLDWTAGWTAGWTA
jgi:hypothetical protein